MTTPPPEHEDPLDVLVALVPRHVWVSLAIALVAVLSGQLFFREGRPPIAADVETIEGRVTAVLDEGAAGPEGGPGWVQTVRIRLARGPQAGEEVDVRHGEAEAVTAENRLGVGDRVLLERVEGQDEVLYYVTDFVRWPGLLALAALFAVVVVLVGGRVGVRALVSMGYSVLILATYIIPGIIAGHDPLLISLTGSLAILASSLYMTYGWRPKTHVAMLGLAISLAATAVLSYLFVGWTRLTGFGSESATFLRFASGVALDMRGILLGGIIIGTLGVLDDVTTNQASVTFELKHAAPGLRGWELFRRSMTVGRDHIAAIINTLLLAYAGASLPLMLLIAVQGVPLGQTLNRGFIAEEVVRTLVGSLGLVLATPVTSVIAAWIAVRVTIPPESGGPEHRH